MFFKGPHEESMAPIVGTFEMHVDRDAMVNAITQHKMTL